MKIIEGWEWKAWLTIWTQPKATARRLVQNRHSLFLLVVLVTLSLVTWKILDKEDRQMFPGAENLHPVLHYLFGVVAFLIAGFVILNLSSWLLVYIGKKLGGKATFLQMRIAQGWSSVPSIWMLLFLLPVYFFSREYFYPPKQQLSISDILTGNHMVVDTQQMFAIVIYYLLIATVSIWSVVVDVKVVAEIHQFSTGKALVTLILGYALIFAVFITVSIIIAILTGIIASFIA